MRYLVALLLTGCATPLTLTPQERIDYCAHAERGRTYRATCDNDQWDLPKLDELLEHAPKRIWVKL